jgi:hypothetical protein
MTTVYQTGAAKMKQMFKPFPDGTAGYRKQTFTVATALTVNNVIEMVPVYAGETVLDIILVTDDLDTAGSPAIVLDVGDGVDTDRYIDGTTVGQTGGTARLGSGITTAKTIGYVYPADDTVDVLVQVAPGTGATDVTITLMVLVA